MTTDADPDELHEQLELMNRHLWGIKSLLAALLLLVFVLAVYLVRGAITVQTDGF